MNHPQAKNPARGPIRKTIAPKNQSVSNTSGKPQVSIQRAPVHAAVQSTLMALEPRMLFDGAGMAAGAEVIDRSVQPTAAEANRETWSEALRDSAVAYEGNSPAQATALLVVDQSVEGWQQLIQGRAANTDVLVLDRNQDGLAQIAGAVAQYNNLQSIQIVSHGDQGVISLGNRLVNEIALNQSAGVLSTIGGALSKDGDILLYGCEVGSGAKGAAFLQALARSTQADVAASIDLTGSSTLGGNWDLETATGAIESSSALSTVGTAAYGALLDSLPVNNGGTGTIRGHLWDDTLAFNNAIDPSENCFADVTVNLIWAGADGVFGNTDDRTYTTQTGDGAVAGELDGIFEFTGLAAGNYKVVVPTNFTDSISRNVKVIGDVNDATGPAGSDGVADNIYIIPGETRADLNFRYLQLNDAPTITGPAQVVMTEDSTFSFVGADAFSIGDSADDMVTAVNSFNGYLTTLTVSDGILTLGPQAGLTIVGSGSATLTIEGSIANINAAIANLTYKPNTDFNGYDYLNIRVDDRGNLGDGNGNCIPGEAADNLFATRQIGLCVNPVNDPPVAVNDANQTTSTSTTAVTGNVIGGSGASPGDRADTDPEVNYPLTICGVVQGPGASSPSGNVGVTIPGVYGTLKLEADGRYSYQVNVNNPTVAALGSGGTITDTFTYCVQDTLGDKAKADLVITIVGQGKPVAAPDVNSTFEGATSPATGNVLGVPPGVSAGDRRDTDPENDTLSVCGVVAGTTTGIPVGNVGTSITTPYGTLTLSANGSYSYQVNNANPDVQALGPMTANLIDTFTYCVTDGKGGFDKTTLTITITGVNDAPKANPDTNSTVAGATNPARGNVLGGGGKAPTDVTDTDPENDALNVCGVIAGTSSVTPTGDVGTPVRGIYGIVQINLDGTYTYQVDNTNAQVANLPVGSILFDTFTYCATDGKGGFDKTTLTITITGSKVPNDPPVAKPDTNTTTADSQTPSRGNVLGGPGKAPTDVTDMDPNNDPLTVCGVVAGNSATVPSTGVGTPVVGTYGTVTVNADGTYSYQVDRNDPRVLALQQGQKIDDVFTYCLSDGKGGLDKTTLTITITGVNDCPVAVSDGNAVSAANGATTRGNAIGGVGATAGDRADTDPDGDALRVCGVSAGNVNGTVSGNVGAPIMGQYGSLTVNADGSYSYVVDASKPGVIALRQGQTLTDTFTYCVTDGVCDPQKAQIVITLNGVNDPPTARGVPDVTDEGGTMRCDLASVADAEDSPAQLSVKIDSIANSASGVFFYREAIAGQPGQFREVPVTAGMTITGEQLANLCFKANPQAGALRGPDGALLPPTLSFTVTDTTGAQASSSTTITIKPPVRVEPPPVAPREVPPIAILPPNLVPPAVPPGFDPRLPPPLVVPPLNLAPALDPVSLFDPATTLVEAPPPDRAVKSAAATADEKPVAKNDDCIPTAKPKVKMKAVKRSVFADAAQKPLVAFSEQMKEAKKRFKLPAKVAPKAPSMKEC